MLSMASGPSSLDPDDRQLAFEDLETAVAEAEARSEPCGTQCRWQPKRPAAKRNLGHLPDHLPRIEQMIEPAQKVCPCGCNDMVKIGEDRSERLDIIPARFQVIVTVRPRYACRRCDGGIMPGRLPHWLIEGGLPTEGTLAHVAVSKYADHLPLYRQSPDLCPWRRRSGSLNPGKLVRHGGLSSRPCRRPDADPPQTIRPPLHG
jgi:transposase